MYYPPGYDKARSIELAQLSAEAYKQLDAHLNKKPWTLPAGYTLITPIHYSVLRTSDGKAVVHPDVKDSLWDIFVRALEKFLFWLGWQGLKLIAREFMPFEKELQKAVKVIGRQAEILLDKDIPVGFVATKGKDAYLVFRGTATPEEWIFDATMKLVPYEKSGWGQIEKGFTDLYQRCRDTFIEQLDGLGKQGYTLYITGHSLGAALGSVALPDVTFSTDFKSPILYNFASPRVGDADFADAYNALPNTASYRLVNTCDLVPVMPLPVPVPDIPSGYYTHVGTPINFTNQLKSIGDNHAISTYLKAVSE